MSTRVLVVGLGTIARTHLTVLAGRHDTVVVGGVEPRGGADHPFPVWPSYDAALAARVEHDLVVVATPTDTHPGLVREVLAGSEARVLCEKPLARDLTAIRALEDADPTLRRRLSVAHHFAFSPEVTWARDQAAARPDWGPPERILSVFNDPYAGKDPGQLASYVSPWVDSGPNQLSLLAGFTVGWEVVDASHEPFRSLTTLAHDGGTSLLVANWLAGDSSKQTVLDFRGGRVQLRMDHTSMTGLLVEDGRVRAHAGYTGTLSRKDAHYAGLYDVLLTDPADPRLGIDLAADIARLLAVATDLGAAGAGAGAEPAVSWRDVSDGPLAASGRSTGGGRP
ncbi:Gfo/Idh/MocA family protein [Nocardioides sp. SYSU DS0651]|uniref:Gfo/Idh/MocA family protein n=1 Tax=Nocardioides sp. SYSU DS0651 TaxID=3415955 RepID=UPI003F4C2E52